MLQAFFALAFLAMIATPAILAATSGRKETEAAEDEVEMETPVPAARGRQIGHGRAATVQFVASTLPMHGTLGMSNR
ncbi:hypothetical protein [Silvibacterium dinghuense]|uniref:Secreted protein n=1 Tax=Silvibacterium dinghuense TaxID=1560006 RepID=A0A4Q1SJR7_9BACT|nr:hypothetical protein [Silvibacterium dinghuense]RXS97901.1 hypothetical protein ESZ00_08605 [Silvibacterium dinghuense]GGH02843.1 hypothetical protein GCM10011586_18410 [Silvibacterium dinghuense]